MRDGAAKQFQVQLLCARAVLAHTEHRSRSVPSYIAPEFMCNRYCYAAGSYGQDNGIGLWQGFARNPHTSVVYGVYGQVCAARERPNTELMSSTILWVEDRPTRQAVMCTNPLQRWRREGKHFQNVNGGDLGVHKT